MILDVLVAWALHVLLQPVNHSLSVLAGLGYLIDSSGRIAFASYALTF